MDAGTTMRVDTATLIPVSGDEIRCPLCGRSDRVRDTGLGIVCERCRVGTRARALGASGYAEWRRRRMKLETK